MLNFSFRSPRSLPFANSQSPMLSPSSSNSCNVPDLFVGHLSATAAPDQLKMPPLKASRKKRQRKYHKQSDRPTRQSQKYRSEDGGPKNGKSDNKLHLRPPYSFHWQPLQSTATAARTGLQPLRLRDTQRRRIVGQQCQSRDILCSTEP